MIRIVEGPEGSAVFDLDGRLSGRGAYVCPSASCLHNLRSSSLKHTLKAHHLSLPDYQSLRAKMLAALESKCLNLMSIGRKAGQVSVGSRAAYETLQKGGAELIIVAADASPRTAGNFFRLAGDAPVRKVAGKETLGRWLGRESVAVAVISDRGLGSRLATVVDRLTAFDYSTYHGESKDI